MSIKIQQQSSRCTHTS